MRNRSEVGARDAKAEKRKPQGGKTPRRDKVEEVVKIPLDPVNEVVVLAAWAVLLGRDPARAKKLADALPPDAFHGSGHAEIATGLIAMTRQGLAYDPMTLRQITGGAADADTLDEYLQARPEPPPNLEHHVSRVRWDQARIEFVRGPMASLIEALRDSSSEPAAVKALAKQAGHSFESYGERRFLLDGKRLVAEQRIALTQMREGHAYFPYGFDGLDHYSPGDVKMVDGFEVPIGPRREVVDGKETDVPGDWRIVPGMAPGNVTTLVATTGSGKTTFTRNSVLAQAKLRRRVLVGAWEQQGGETLRDIAVLSLGWSRSDLASGRYSKEDQRELEDEMDVLCEWIQFFALPFERRPGERNFNDKNLDLIQEHIEGSGCDVFYADLFQRALAQKDPENVAAALERMKAMALETRKHVVLVHQINVHKLGARGGGVPTEDLIKGVGEWLEVADNCICLHRDGKGKDVSDDKVLALIFKCRYGRAPQAVEMNWDGEFGVISGGRTVPYHYTGEEEEDDLLAAPKPAGFRRGNRRRR